MSRANPISEDSSLRHPESWSIEWRAQWEELRANVIFPIWVNVVFFIVGVVGTHNIVLDGSWVLLGEVINSWEVTSLSVFDDSGLPDTKSEVSSNGVINVESLTVVESSPIDCVDIGGIVEGP